MDRDIIELAYDTLPDGWIPAGQGPLKHPLKRVSTDIACYGRRGYHWDFRGCKGEFDFLYAVRAGSWVAKRNRLKPAPCVDHEADARLPDGWIFAGRGPIKYEARKNRWAHALAYYSTTGRRWKSPCYITDQTFLYAVQSGSELAEVLNLNPSADRIIIMPGVHSIITPDLYYRPLNHTYTRTGNVYDERDYEGRLVNHYKWRPLTAFAGHEWFDGTRTIADLLAYFWEYTLEFAKGDIPHENILT